MHEEQNNNTSIAHPCAQLCTETAQSRDFRADTIGTLVHIHLFSAKSDTTARHFFWPWTDSQLRRVWDRRSELSPGLFGPRAEASTSS